MAKRNLQYKNAILCRKWPDAFRGMTAGNSLASRKPLPKFIARKRSWTPCHTWLSLFDQKGFRVSLYIFIPSLLCPT